MPFGTRLSKPGQMMLDSPELYVPEQNRLFLAGFKFKYAWRRRFLFRRLLPTSVKHHLTRFPLIELHEWIALAFLVLVVVHLVWHWSYIMANAKCWLSPPAKSR